MPRYFVNLFCLSIVLCLGAATVGAQVQSPLPVPAKKAPKDPKIKTKTPPPVTPGFPMPGVFEGDDNVTSERSMIVDAGVAVKLCVSHGDLKINGWRRNEVRVFVKDGREFNINALEKSPTSGKPNWLLIGAGVEGRPGQSSQCLTGDSIEIDAPQGAIFDLSGRAARTSIDSVKTVKVKIVEGVITLRNIPGGITAYTSQGDVIVENSGGAISLESTTGNIVAVEVTPGQIGEVLKAKTNGGSISLQRVAHRQIEANSISGSLLFEGKFLTGGIYNFRTSNGSITLSVPIASVCTIDATYGFGNFESDIPMKVLTENITPQAKRVVAKIGTGEGARVTLSTTRGTIAIKRQAGLP